MVFNATFNNISVISWRSVLLVDETRVPGEHHRPVASHWQNLSQDFASSTPSHELDDMRMVNLSLSIYNFVHMYTIGLQTKYVDKSNNCSISPKTGKQYTNIS